MNAVTRPRRGRSEPLWTRIDRNRLKSAAFVFLFVAAAAVSLAVVVTAGSFLLGIAFMRSSKGPGAIWIGPYLTLGALVLGAAIAAIHVMMALRRPTTWLPVKFGAVPCARGALPVTESALLDMAIAVGRTRAPWLWVVEDCDRVNAFAVGLRDGSEIVGVTRGLIDRLSGDQQRAVFANLMARVKAGDTLWATVLSAIMGPIWSQRAEQFRKDPILRDEPTWGEALTGGAMRSRQDSGSQGLAAMFILGSLAVVLTELLMGGHERAARAGAEKADAEGMLLLKDPAQMLAALEGVLWSDNTVPGAGEAYSALFFCWAGFGYAPEDDPEMRRIGRLREVLGASGAA